MAKDAAAVFDALADPTRRNVVQLLSHGPRRAGEIAAAAGTSGPAMSRHLRILLAAGVVTDERSPADARVRVFHLRPDSVAAAAAWLVPGLGHALLKMWSRALAIFFTVGLLVILGASMRGNIFPPNGDDAFSKLGYVADMGAGSFYFLARALEVDGPDVSRATGDYGTRLLATAGVLNLLAALHAYEIIRGRKA